MEIEEERFNITESSDIEKSCVGDLVFDSNGNAWGTLWGPSGFSVFDGDKWTTYDLHPNLCTT